MGRPLTPKCKQCRRVGEKLFLKGDKCFTTKCPIVKRSYPPGIHGPNQRSTRLSEFGMQLREKQKAKAMYRLLEKQIFAYYKKAMVAREETGLVLLSLLERRLDNVVYRLGLSASRDQARQLVSHGLVHVNGRRIDVPSYLVKTGNKISLKPKRQDMTLIKDNISGQKADLPDWLDFDLKNMSAQVINLPEAQDLELGINTRLIIEYYSR